MKYTSSRTRALADDSARFAFRTTEGESAEITPVQGEAPEGTQESIAAQEEIKQETAGELAALAKDAPPLLTPPWNPEVAMPAAMAETGETILPSPENAPRPGNPETAQHTEEPDVYAEQTPKPAERPPHRENPVAPARSVTPAPTFAPELGGTQVAVTELENQAIAMGGYSPETLAAQLQAADALENVA